MNLQRLKSICAVSFLTFCVVAHPSCSQQTEENFTDSLAEVSSEELKEDDLEPYWFVPEENENKLFLDLEKVVNLAISQNLDILIASSRLRQSQGQLISSFADLLPSIRFSSSIERFEGGEVFFGADPINLDRTTQRFGVFGDYAFQTGGKFFFQVASSKNRLNQAKEFRNRSFQLALRDSVISYFTWLNDIARNEVAQQSLEESISQLSLTQARLKNGFATQLELMQNSTLKSENENLVLETKNRELISSVNLAALLNVPVGNELVTNEDFLKPITFLDQDFSIEEAIRIAANNRPDLRELKYAITESKYNFASAIADFFPTLSASGFVRQIGPDLNDLDNSEQGIISLDIDVLKNLGVGRIGNLKSTKASISEAKLNHEKQLVEATKQIAKAYYDKNLFEDKLRVASDKLKSSAEAYRIALARLKSSVGINLEVVQALTKYTEARLQYKTAAANFNSAQIALLYEVGLLTPEQVVNNIYTNL
ncbi:MAG: TolC family protein [Candidatus Caenarcaniphilales bacterium]|nr:TolC family protein [Candidatus Caenarcaniphilales bacterium]